jgi:leader peptidase (prepilin peptidase)/N-methyltransferase
MLTGLVFVLGLLVGSFLNVVIHRLPRMMEAEWRAGCAELTGVPRPETAAYNLALPPSTCPACGHRITLLENIPVLSWLVLRGRCSACAHSISLRYPLVELGTALLAAFAALHFGAGVALLGALLFIGFLIPLILIDLDAQLLPDDLTLPLLWLGLLFNLVGVFTSLQSAVLGAVAGYLVLWVTFHLFKLLTGKEGMGYGDFKLLAALGAWLGWEMLPMIVILSALVGVIVGLGLMAFKGHQRDVPIPFGPYLGGAGLIAMFYGPSLTQAYLGMY